MNIGNPSRSLALAESGRREYLPVDDVLFERGVCPQIMPQRLHADLNGGKNNKRTIVCVIFNKYCCCTVGKIMPGISLTQSRPHARQ